MNFPWQTEKARRKQERDEEFARMAVYNFHKTMADILREQRERNVLRPARRRALAEQEERK